MDAQQEKTFSFVGENLSLDFANTAGSLGTDAPTEYLQSYADLVAWGRQAGVLSQGAAGQLLLMASKNRADAEAVYNRALDLKKTLRRIFVAVADGSEAPGDALQEFNDLLSEAMCYTRVEPGTEGGYLWGWKEMEKSLGSVLWPVARSAADLLISGDLKRVRRCASDTCGWLFLDMTRNHSRQWCDMRDCGNRAKARRHYHKKKGTAE